MDNIVVCLTGHRPKDLPCKWERQHPWKLKKIEALINYYTQLSPAYIISGAAIGWDSWGIYAALKVGIPYKMYIPFKGQENLWSEAQKKIYYQYLDKANDVQYICPDGYAAWKMQRRNEAMVDDSDSILALWNPEKRKGGTWNCISYGLGVKKEVINFWGDKPIIVDLNNGIVS